MSAQPRKPFVAWGGMGGPTRREHPVPGVAPAVQIEGFNPNHSTKGQVVPPMHKSTSLSQKFGDTARGFASTDAKHPSHPIVADTVENLVWVLNDEFDPYAWLIGLLLIRKDAGE